MREMVSIIVPTYNREKQILRAVESILNQSYQDFELIIVDDGSKDNTEAVIQEIDDTRIRYIKLSENQGVAHARNIGIQEAKYEYIAFLDSDDEWLPEKLELQMRKMCASSKKTGLVFCRMSGKNRNSEDRFVCPPENYKKEILEGSIFYPLLMQNVIGTPAMLVRKKCLEEVGGFKEALQCLEDWELILRIADKWQIGFVDKILVEVHKSDGSVSTNMGGFLVARCYMVSLYRKEMSEAGILEQVKSDILAVAEKCDLRAEVAELLTRDIQL